MVVTLPGDLVMYLSQKLWTCCWGGFLLLEAAGECSQDISTVAVDVFRRVEVDVSKEDGSCCRGRIAVSFYVAHLFLSSARLSYAITLSSSQLSPDSVVSAVSMPNTPPPRCCIFDSAV